jgi:hypothetical protein
MFKTTGGLEKNVKKTFFFVFFAMFYLMSFF